MAKRRFTKAEMMTATDLPWEDVAMPEWGDDVEQRVQGLSAKESMAIAKSMVVLGPDGQPKEMNINDMPDDVMAKLLVKTLVDENGQRILTDSDTAIVMGWSAAAVKRLNEAAMRLSGMGDKKGVDKAVKN